MYYNFHTNKPSYQPLSFTSTTLKVPAETTPSRKIYQPPYQKLEYSPIARTPVRQKKEQIHNKPIKQTIKSGGHKQYFEKQEIRCIKPISVNKVKYQFTPSEQSTSAQLSQITYKPQPVSLDWNYIRRKTDTNLFKNFNLGCYLEHSKKVSSFCTCSAPCRWADRWSNWAKMPKQTIYAQIKQRPLQREADQQIRKDLKRTQCGSLIMQFSYLRMLRQILQAYSKYDQITGYIQGMNMIVSVILHHVKDPQQTFWIFVDIMERREFKQIYLNDFQKLHQHTKNINKLVEYKINDLYLHLIENGVGLQLVTTGWLLSMMCNIIPLQYAHLMVDMFITEGFQGFYKVIMTYLLYLKQELMIREDASDILSRFSSTYKQQDVDWEEILNSAILFKLN